MSGGAPVVIGGHDLSRRTLIIAEAGNNHEGDFECAREMVRAAARAGVDAIKFQTIVPERLVAPGETARLAQLGRFRFSYDQFAALARTAQEAGLIFLSTPFDIESVAALDPLSPVFKIASGDNNFLPLIEAVGATGKPVLLSTGMTDLATVALAKQTLEAVWARREGGGGGLVLLQCTVSYPCEPEDANLRAMTDLARLGCPVGFSDHTIGLDAAVLSVALGGVVIEKHFTLDKNQSDFRDHQLSADEADLTELVRRVRLAEQLLGDGVKRVLPVEEKAVGAVRRGAVARMDLAVGDALSADSILWVRPAVGLSPADAGALSGRRLAVARRRGETIGPEHLEPGPSNAES